MAFFRAEKLLAFGLIGKVLAFAEPAQSPNCLLRIALSKRPFARSV